MKLTLDELRVDGSMIQPTEAELAEVKGGWIWFFLDVLGWTAAGITIYCFLTGGGSSETNGTKQVKFKFEYEGSFGTMSIEYESKETNGNCVEPTRDTVNIINYKY